MWNKEPASRGLFDSVNSNLSQERLGKPASGGYIRAVANAEHDVAIVVTDGRLDAGKPSKPKFRTAQRDGKRVRVRIVDADSPHFAADFTASFAANVRRARSENRAIDKD
jgi:hypothetical protein